MAFGLQIENWLKNDKMIPCCNDVFYDSDWNSLGYDKIKMAKIWSDYKKFRNAPASKIWSYLVSGLWINRNITN